MKTDNKFYTKWWFWVIIAVVFLGLLGMFVPSESDSDNSYETDSKSSYNNDVDNSELIYLQDIQKLHSDIQEVLDMDFKVMTGILTETYSLYDASRYFKESMKFYNTVGNYLDEMSVPIKYKEAHTHYINSIRYMEEAAGFIEQGCIYLDVDLLNRATTKIELATKEMNKFTSIIESLS